MSHPIASKTPEFRRRASDHAAAHRGTLHGAEVRHLPERRSRAPYPAYEEVTWVLDADGSESVRQLIEAVAAPGPAQQTADSPAHPEFAVDEYRAAQHVYHILGAIVLVAVVLGILHVAPIIVTLANEVARIR